MWLHSMYVIGVFMSLLLMAGCQNEQRDSRTAPAQTPAPTPAAPTPAVQTMTATTPVLQIPPRFGKQEEEYQAPVAPTRPPQEMTLVAMPVKEAPTIDGQAQEAFWDRAPAIVTLDYSSQRPITIKSVYTSTEIFFLVTYPDEEASETHKTWVWDPKEEIYREGPDREDVFIVKWSMSGNNVNMALRDPEPHRGDIWFWKARRTNPIGYADDKWQSLSYEPGPNTRKIQSSHGPLFFRREGDAGEPAFEEKFFFEYQGNTLEKYVHRQPQGSRGDVRAKGVWNDGQWTIEFGRKLNTGHDDDVAFLPGQTYLFGVACYAMAYDTPHDAWAQPLYRTGDTFDKLFLTFAPRKST